MVLAVGAIHVLILVAAFAGGWAIKALFWRRGGG